MAIRLNQHTLIDEGSGDGNIYLRNYLSSLKLFYNIFMSKKHVGVNSEMDGT